MSKAPKFADSPFPTLQINFTKWWPTIRNMLTSLLEAVIVLVVTQLPLLLGLISHVMDNDGVTFSVDTAIEVFGRTFSPGDVLSYVAGILGSSMAFFVVKLGVFKRKPIMVAPLIIAPFLILFFAAPVYIQDIDGQVGNEDFVNSYIRFLLSCSVVVWLFSLYQSRVLFDVGLPSKSGPKTIVDEIEGEMS